MYQLRFQGNKITSIYTEMDIYFKELAHMIVGASKCDTCRVGQQAEILGKS